MGGGSHRFSTAESSATVTLTVRDLRGKPAAELTGAACADGTKRMNNVRPLTRLTFAGKPVCVDPRGTPPAALKTLQLEGVPS